MAEDRANAIANSSGSDGASVHLLGPKAAVA